MGLGFVVYRKHEGIGSTGVFRQDVSFWSKCGITELVKKMSGRL